MTINQFERQLKTWRRENRDTYENIMMLAKERGILTKRGNVTTSTKNREKVSRFFSEYQRQFGSYTSYMKKLKERRKKAIDEYAKNLIENEEEEIVSAYAKAREDIGNVKQYEENMKELNDLVQDLFSATYYDKEKSRAYLDQSRTMPLKDAIDYIKRKIEELKK